MKSLQFIAKHDGKINLAIFGSFIVGGQVTNANTKYPTAQALTADPGTRVTDIIAVDGASLAVIDEPEDSLTTSNGAVLGVVALAVASFVFV